MARVVNLEVEKDGRWYEVIVSDPATGDVIEEYRAGNHAWDSGGFVEPDSDHALNFEWMKRFALVTGEEMAKEHDAALDENIQVIDEDGNVV